MMQMGKNSVSAEKLRRYVERIENIQAQKASLGDDEKVVFAEAKAEGFVAPAIRYVIKQRKLKPSDRQENEAIRDLYMHAMGMAVDTPLFRTVGLMSVDITAREAVVEALKKFVPADGSIEVEAGGNRIKLTRGKDGEVRAAEVKERPLPDSAQPGGGAKPRVKPDAPDVDGAGAEKLGHEAFKADQPIIANPFPYGDDRRARWDKGWREESGSDGMDDD